MVPNRCQIFGITLPLSLCLNKLELENSKLFRGPLQLSFLIQRSTYAPSIQRKINAVDILGVPDNC